jgi:pyruvate dehydrogenase complex dehydrogenase (E1) component
MHFWHGAEGERGGDLIYVQGHSSPGIYARAYLEVVVAQDDRDGVPADRRADAVLDRPVTRMGGLLVDRASCISGTGPRGSAAAT